MRITRWRLGVLGACVLFSGMGMSGQGGCQTDPPVDPNAGLEGVYSITRGATKVTFNWTVASGGQTQQDSVTSELLPLDPADFPDVLHPLVDQWNNGLADLNAKLDEALPDSVIVTLPRFAVVRMEDAADPTRVGEGLINDQAEYLMIGDLSGGGQGSDQGAGGVLQASSVSGRFDRSAHTTTGALARTLLVVLLGPNSGGLSFSAQISVDYSGERTGDVPASPAAQ